MVLCEVVEVVAIGGECLRGITWLYPSPSAEPDSHRYCVVVPGHNRSEGQLVHQFSSPTCIEGSRQLTIVSFTSRRQVFVPLLDHGLGFLAPPVGHRCTRQPLGLGLPALGVPDKKVALQVYRIVFRLDLALIQQLEQDAC